MKVKGWKFWLEAAAGAGATLLLLLYFFPEEMLIPPARGIIMFLEELTDFQVGVTLTRVANATFLLLVGVELIASARWVGNKRLMTIIWKGATFTLLFFFLKVVASIMDGYTGLAIAWASNLVNLAFWGIIIYRLDRARIVLKSDRNTETRKELRALADTLLDKLELAKANLTTLKNSVET